ncbi:hypothetical protein Prum_060440 [Phytohabitans rumicis]|uniref:Uncharacterized protein n=1 Tax=Phytohabitans rumicis TaxID=1076125 RepID=A0A6V8L556_9ACTN|nr:hypothetical protein [Phytohabitans rumicis]GFJ92402.1 hypothetical protein Prum_060440 [Phytohabitans rumicis]
MLATSRAAGWAGAEKRIRPESKRSSEPCTSGMASLGNVRNGLSNVAPPSLLIAYARLPGSVPRSRASA